MSTQDSHEGDSTRRADRLPREIEWADLRAQRAYRDYSQFEKWKQDIVDEHGAERADIPDGIQAWYRFRNMIRAATDTQIQEMLDNPSSYYTFKELIRERAGQHSMRYNRQTIRLVMRFYDKADGESVVEILRFGYRYGDDSGD